MCSPSPELLPFWRKKKYVESVTDTPSQEQALQCAYHTTSRRQARMKRSQELLAKKKWNRIPCPTDLLLTSPTTIKMSSSPYFAFEILRAIKRRMTAMIDMVQTTEMDAAASAHRLSLSEGTTLTQSWGIIAKVSKFFLILFVKISSKISSSYVSDAKRI